MTIPEEKRSQGAQSRPLRNGPYILLKQQAIYSWGEDMQERWWIGRGTGQEAQRLFLLCEVCLTGGRALFTTILQPAIARIMHLSQHPQVASLVNVFSEDGHHYFVFEAPGESLATYLQQIEDRLALSEALQGCQQLLHFLQWLSHQQPALHHGSICLEHVRVVAPGQWILSHFSILQSCGAIRERVAHISPSEHVTTMPNGVTDQAGDLYAVMATVLSAATGEPTMTPHVQIQQLARWYPDQAELLTRLFTKALHPIAPLRAQHPEELLPLVEQIIGRPKEHSRYKRETTPDIARMREFRQRQESQSRLVDQQAFMQQVSVPIPSALPASGIAPSLPLEHQGALPRLISLPPLPPAHDGLAAFIWTCGILLCLCCLFLFSF